MIFFAIEIIELSEIRCSNIQKFVLLAFEAPFVSITDNSGNFITW